MGQEVIRGLTSTFAKLLANGGLLVRDFLPVLSSRITWDVRPRLNRGIKAPHLPRHRFCARDFFFLPRQPFRGCVGGCLRIDYCSVVLLLRGKSEGIFLCEGTLAEVPNRQ